MSSEELHSTNMRCRSHRQCTCSGCGSPILDQFILRVAPDLEWHASCLKCADCGSMLDEMRTCFVRDGKTYCKMDYFRLFGAKCATCNLGFGVADLVMRARNQVYHVDCFRCVACGRHLVPGDEFALSDEGLLCRADHDSITLDRHPSGVATGAGGLLKTSVLSPPDSVASGDDVISYGNNNNNNNNNDSLAMECVKPTTTPTRNGSRSHGGHAVRLGGSRSHKSSDQKTTRIRTVLNEKQLHTLRTCYGANPRPDALMKEQLVEMTGLSPRVIRVWFQNKRCKDKKRSILMKQLQSQQQQHQQQDNNDTCNVDEMWMYHKASHAADSCSPVDDVDSQTLPPHGQVVPTGVHQITVDFSNGSGSGPTPTSWKALHPDYDDDDDDDQLDDPDMASTRLRMAHLDGAQQTAFQQLVNSFGGGIMVEPSGLASSTTTGETDDDTVVSFDESMSASLVAGGFYHRGPLPSGAASGGGGMREMGIEMMHGRAAPFGRHHHQHRGLNVSAS